MEILLERSRWALHKKSEMPPTAVGGLLKSDPTLGDAAQKLSAKRAGGKKKTR